MKRSGFAGSMFRFAGDFRNAWIVENLHCGAVADFFPILQHPDDFLVRSHFDELGALAIFAARGEDGVAVGQPGAALRGGGELIFRWQICVAIEFPDRFALGIDFTGKAVPFVGDQRVAVLQPESGPRLLIL